MPRTIILILSLLPLVVQAQITAPLSNTMRLTDYPSAGWDDQVFIFCIDDASGRGTLSATARADKKPFTFTWTRYDEVARTFTIPVKTESGETSTASNLVEGGYKVFITNSLDWDTIMYAWVSLDKPVANAALQNFTCEYVALNGTKAVDQFYYYDPSSGVSRLLPNNVSHLWSSIPSSIIPYPDYLIDPITFSPPLVDVEYMLQVTDAFGCSSSSTFDYTSIHVKAGLTADPTEGSAPLKVKLEDQSVRGDFYTWKFGDDSLSHDPDPGSHTYYTPRDYVITLIIESEQTCRDSATVTISVKQPELSIPNVFSPDDDGVNDFFLPRTVSLKYINVQIFAKSGHRVFLYQGKGEDIQNWPGWDGKVNNSERVAEPGIYYYIIRARGYDEELYEGSEYRGFLYLFR